MRRWLVSSAGSGTPGSRKPGSSGGDPAASQGGAEAVGGCGPSCPSERWVQGAFAYTDRPHWPWLQHHQYMPSLWPWARRDPVRLLSIKARAMDR